MGCYLIAYSETMLTISYGNFAINVVLKHSRAGTSKYIRYFLNATYKLPVELGTGF